MSRILISGAGGFIGSHLVRRLKAEGHFVRGIDIKQSEFENSSADEFLIADLRLKDAAWTACEGVDTVYALAANMGGMEFISNHHAEILHDNLLININTIEAARRQGVKHYLFTSSACVYPEFKQMNADVSPLKETDAWPAQPQDAYGLEKLTTEELVRHYSDEYGMDRRIVRFHNIFGERGTWDGERAKAPAALCRKVAIAKLTGDHEIEIIGDGEQTRSFCYIEDCVNGLVRLMGSGYAEPVNLGTDRLVTINQLADIIADIAGINITKWHVEGAQGVRGRNADLTLMERVLNWTPQVSLEQGLERTYQWIFEMVQEKYGAAEHV